MSYKPKSRKTGGVGVNAGDVVFQLGGATGDLLPDDTFQIGSTAGLMDVYGSVDGTNYLTAPIALIDLCSATPSVAVLATTANKHFGFRGLYKAIQIRQSGATAVANAYVAYTESA